MHKPIVILTTLLLSFGSTTAFQAEVAGIKDSKSILGELEARISTISTKELKKEITANPDLVLIDIRTKSEIAYLGGSIKATQNTHIPRGWLEFRITKVAQHKDIPIVVYCGGGLRSPLAADTLMKMGYTDVKDYNDGFLGWKKAGLPITTPE